MTGDQPLLPIPGLAQELARAERRVKPLGRPDRDCPRCGCQESMVRRARERATDGVFIRRRVCRECRYRFTTYESGEDPRPNVAANYRAVAKPDALEAYITKLELENASYRAVYQEIRRRLGLKRLTGDTGVVVDATARKE